MQYRILHYESLDSTSNLAKQLAESGAEEGTVVFADFQKAGRGQFDRTWQSPKGKDLLFSMIVRPNEIKTNSASMMTQLVAGSVKRVLAEQFKIESKIKRPNDLLAGGKKICGILVESSSKGKDVEYFVIGVGLNVNAGKSEIFKGATSVKLESGKTQNRTELLNHILKVFQADYEPFRGGVHV